VLNEVIVGKEAGFKSKHKIVFQSPRVAEYRASVDDIANDLTSLLMDSALRDKMGQAGRERVVKYFDYRVVAARFVQIIHEKLGIQ
jgi:glycosyltransferase involved in cell wall biosynthesis